MDVESARGEPVRSTQVRTRAANGAARQSFEMTTQMTQAVQTHTIAKSTNSAFDTTRHVLAKLQRRQTRIGIGGCVFSRYETACRSGAAVAHRCHHGRATKPATRVTIAA